MKKLLLVSIMILISLVGKAQTTIKFEKYGASALVGRVKVDGIVTISDSTLTIRVDYKGKVEENTLKIVSKSETNAGSTYNCIGQVGTSDKHQFVFVPSSRLGIWTLINSFSTPNTKVEIYFTLSKN
jgi:hypothetical protein